MTKNICDEVGYWSEIKLDIIKDYAQAYTNILSKQPLLKFSYIDAFAGSGVHIAKSSGEFIPGSPLNALAVEPPFHEFHLIDINQDKADNLRILSKDYSNVVIYDGDCNQVLRDKVFPSMKYEDYRRSLCILDPYGLHLDWEIIREAGQMRSIEIFLNFPVADMNRNVLWSNPSKVEPTQRERMNAFWGDESWEKAAYTTLNLFGLPEKESNEKIAKAFQKRLKDIAGFASVPDPIPMRNAKNAIVYYLFFASNKPVAARIVDHIFKKYKDKRV